MAELVRALVGGVSKNVSRALAESAGLEVVDEPTHNPDGTVRAATTAQGRKPKPKTTVAKKAAEKKAAVTSAPDNEEKS